MLCTSFGSSSASICCFNSIFCLTELTTSSTGRTMPANSSGSLQPARAPLINARSRPIVHLFLFLHIRTRFIPTYPFPSNFYAAIYLFYTFPCNPTTISFIIRAMPPLLSIISCLRWFFNLFLFYIVKKRRSSIITIWPALRCHEIHCSLHNMQCRHIYE